MASRPSLRWNGTTGLFVALGLLLPAAACQGFGSARPNMILVLVDTLRADYLGAYGFQGGVSPNLDRLAGESIRFSHCFSQAPWTKPSVASLLTSLYPQVHGLTNHDGKYWGQDGAGARAGVLPQSAVTLAERLKQRGYRTAAFVTNSWIMSRYGFDQGFELYYDAECHRQSEVSDITDDLQKWLSSLGPDEPYFVYVHAMDVHAPYCADLPDFAAVRGSPSVASTKQLSPREMPEARYQNFEVRPKWATDAERSKLSYWRARYASGIHAFDRRFEDLLKGLQQTGQLDRSLLIVTADHGEELFEHGDWSHGHTLFDHQIHVPLLIRKPGGRGGGRTVDGLVELVDLMPTLLAIAGAEPVPAAQGLDISRTLSGWSGTGRADTFSTATQRMPGLYALRTATHKLTFDADSGLMRLYDLKGDPGERVDISQARPELTQELLKVLMARLRESIEHGTLRPETLEIPQQEQERLRGLGYLK